MRQLTYSSDEQLQIPFGTAKGPNVMPEKSEDYTKECNYSTVQYNIDYCILYIIFLYNFSHYISVITSDIPYLNQ